MTYGAETWTLTKQAQNKLAASQTKMERIMLNITYKDRKTNIWVRERTKVIDIINTVRKMKWSWLSTASKTTDGPRVSPLGDHNDKKRRHGRPAKRWRDDLDKYWSDTIWQRKAQDRVIWRRHAEAFAQHGTQRLHNDDDDSSNGSLNIRERTTSEVEFSSLVNHVSE